MTVPISKAISPVYLGDGSQTVFAFPFKVFTSSDILVSINNGEYISEADAATYSVEINVGDTPGGNITLNTPLPEGQKLVILRDVKFEQAIPQSNGQAHYAEDFEKMVDLLTFQTQYLAEKISRCIELDPTITPTLTELITQVNSAASSAEQSKVAAEGAVDEITGQVAAHTAAANPHPQYVHDHPYAFNPNFIINGGFQVWSNGESFTTISLGYGPDRWRIDPDTIDPESIDPVNLLWEKTTDGMKITATDGGVHLIQYLDSYKEFSGQKITVSFDIKSTIGAQVIPRPFLYYTSELHIYANGSSFNIDNNWQRISFVLDLSGLTAEQAKLYIVPYSANYELRNVKLELGEIATPFEYQDYNVESLKCDGFKRIAAYGVVKSDGAKLSGSDNWTVARNSTGNYQLNITDAGNYIVNVSFAEHGSGEVIMAMHDQITGIFGNGDQSNIRTRGYTEVETDDSWSFFAVKL